MELSEEKVDTLREDAELVLSRRSKREDAAPFLILAAVSDAPTPGNLARLEHEYRLRDELEPTFAARPVALVREDGRPALRLDDPGGELLARLNGRPWESRTFLRVAIGLTVSLGRVHERGLVHKDLKPANVLTNASTGEAWLTGFGIASRLPREQRAAEPPLVIAGTLAYMAPEQTGRMNRSVDSRSDLYSLGVTFYEMLTGALPFDASDPMEWVHCQIARQAPVIPGQLGAVVAKLLAKPAECRYQTAAGLLADLRRCLNALETTGRIDPFPLGEADVPDRPLVPERLYGRERDIETLLAAFERVVRSGELEVVLVSGYSGIGKSSLVNELHKSLVPSRALFASGKFDQYKRDVPYATLAQALESLARSILALGEAELAQWRSALVRVLAPNGRLVTDLVPLFERVIGPQAPVPDLPPAETRNRFQMVFRQLIAVFARPEHPLALFLDDLQWLDAATLKLLQALVAQRDSLSLLLIGAYRDNEVHAAHPLVPALDAIRESGARVHELELAPLAREQLSELVADALRTDPLQAAPLAGLVHEKTAGNPFFAIELLGELVYEKLITFKPSLSAFTWDAARIHAKGYSDNVVDLMATKLTRLGSTTQDVLRQMACLGHSVTVSTLALVRATSEGAVEADLWEALHAGIVVRANVTYAFAHDRVQEAVYSAIPEDRRTEAHLRIGRLLLSRLGPRATAEDVFHVVSQLNAAVGVIEDPEERTVLRALNVRAGRKARAAGAYTHARDYLALAKTLSSVDSWQRDYAATFDLYLLLAECEFLVGHFDVADELFATILERAGSNVDRSSAHCVRLELYQVAGKYEEGFSSAREALRLFDVSFPESDADINAAVEAEYRLVPSLLGHRMIADLADGPQVSDPALRSLMDLLVYAGPCAYVGSPKLFPLVTLMAVTLSIRCGNTDVSCRAYGAYAVMLVSMFGDILGALEFSEMALRLNEKHGKPRDRASLLMMHGHLVVPWNHPFATAALFQEQAFSTSLEVGDLACAGYLAFLSVWQLIERGDVLDDVVAVSGKYAGTARQTNNDVVYQTICLEQQFVASLQGKSDPSFDEGASLAVISRATFRTGIAFHFIMKEILAFHRGGYVEAVTAATAADPYLRSVMGLAIEATHRFYRALTLVALASGASADDRERHAVILADTARLFATWASHCPATFGARNLLLQAEMARMEGHDLDAMRLYEVALQAARENHRLQDEALALELSGQLLQTRGIETAARAHFRLARQCYARWGAHGKVEQLEGLHGYLRKEAPQPTPSPTIGVSLEHLDLATVLRVVQAVSSEIVLERWIERLMTIALEDAGAQRGVLLVPHGEGQRSLAEAITARGGVEVRLSKTEDLPSSLLRYVARTHETVLLDDAASASPFSADPYVAARRSRSILCLPLVRQERVAGILYLENDLAPAVFTPRRTAVLKLVVSQAALSLENARLHESLRRSEAYLAEAQRLSHTGSFGWDLSTGSLVFSEETYRLFGFERSSALEVDDALARVHPEDVVSVRENLDRAVRTGGNLEYGNRLVLPDGSVKFVHVRGRPIRDASGSIEYVGAFMDITDRVQAETALQSSQAELARVMRVTALGELAASIAHEVNQPLMAVSANGSAALNWLGFDPPRIEDAREALTAIVADGERAGDILSRIRRLLSRAPAVHAACDVNAIVSGVLPLVRSQFDKQSVLLEAALAADVPPVLGDPVQLQQVLLNLLLNAADACARVGIERRRVTARTAVERQGTELRAVVAVTDTGKGIDPSSVARLFEPFYTTKPEGLGMGLSISRSIVARHGGELTLAPNADHGVTLTFSLPARP